MYSVQLISANFVTFLASKAYFVKHAGPGFIDQVCSDLLLQGTALPVLRSKQRCVEHSSIVQKAAVQAPIDQPQTGGSSRPAQAGTSNQSQFEDRSASQVDNDVARRADVIPSRFAAMLFLVPYTA
jgi:hypothetical protein